MNENAFIAVARSGQNGFWRYLTTIALVVALTLGPSSCLIMALMILFRSPGPSSQMPGYMFLVVSLIPFLFVPPGLWMGRRWQRAGAGAWLVVILALVLSACGQAPLAETTATPSAGQTGTPETTLEATPEVTSQVTAAPVAAAALKDCKLEGTQIEAQCGALEVLENRALPEGRKIVLNIVVLKATSRNPAPDPLFLLAGGPGQAATQVFTNLAGTLARIREKRDLVMVDQRGVGKSAPLSCAPQPSQTTPTPGIIRADPPVQDQLAEMDACLQNFQGVDLTQYTTDVAMQDLDDVRQALGYETINLLGVSYGTRAALAYLGLYPDRVRSLVLDGVAPLGWALGATMRADAQRALDLIFLRCEKDANCHEKFPNLKRELADLISGLYDSTQPVTVPDPLTGEPTQVEISPLMISSTVRMMSYNDNQAALIPLMIHQAAEGNFTILVSQYLQLFRSLDASVDVGMYYSVWCYEDLPHLPVSGELGEYYFDPDLDVSRSICERWPVINHAIDIPNTTNTDVPMLLISGEADPVTPPANGDLVAHGFSNSLHLVLPGMGHNNFYTGCMRSIVRDFIDQASAANLETGCLQNIAPLPFFLSPVGPQPSSR